MNNFLTNTYVIHTNFLFTEGTKNIIEEMKKVQLERLKENDDIRLFTRENPRPMDETVLLEKTLQKIKPQILINWENLKSLLRTLDTDGESTISMADMRVSSNIINYLKDK